MNRERLKRKNKGEKAERVLVRERRRESKRDGGKYRREGSRVMGIREKGIVRVR